MKNNLLLYILLGTLLLMLLSCKTDKSSTNDLEVYSLQIDDELIKLDGYDYVTTTNDLPVDDKSKVITLKAGTHSFMISKPINDNNEHQIIKGNEVMYEGSSTEFKFDIEGEGIQIYTLKTAYIKPFRFYINVASDIEIPTQLIKEEINQVPVQSPDKEYVIEDNATVNPDSNEPSEQMKEVKVINGQFKDDPNYELVVVDGTNMYKRIEQTEKNEQESLEKPEIDKKPKPIKIPNRLRKFGSITNTNCNTDKLDARNGPFEFTITPKTFLNLKNINVYGASNWNAKVLVYSKDGLLNETVSNEAVVKSKCELNLSSIETILLPEFAYKITISSNSSDAKLFNLEKCGGYISSNEHMIIEGEDAKFISKLFYKY